ncbi:MAG: FAD:protein transferase [Solirubrobacteraceae bacterium]|nr:FAD:protein transferase [Solirubrobacteraceae bacterium]
MPPAPRAPRDGRDPATTSAARFDAMGCEVVVGGATDAELGAIRRVFERRERVFSRLRPDSELCWVDRSEATTLAVSAVFAEALADALQAARQTGGLVAPTRCGTPVRLAGRLLTRAPGVELDLDGIVTSRAVDDAVRLISGPGYVAAGGAVASRSGTVVALPGRGALHLRSGGLATRDAPAASPWSAVTVAAGRCRDAHVAARAAAGLGADGPAWLDEHGLAGRFLSTAGAVANHHWRAAAEAEASPLP